jgi:hypothetical protein
MFYASAPTVFDGDGKEYPIAFYASTYATISAPIARL